MKLMVTNSLINLLPRTHLSREFIYGVASDEAGVDVTGFESVGTHISKEQREISDRIEAKLVSAHGDAEYTDDYTSSLPYVVADARKRNDLDG